MNGLAEIVGDSAGIRRLREQLQQMLTRAATARRPPPILLLGETGTGKGLVARTMHRAGPRAHAPFVDVNCAAIPETLLEAELFGYERGAFTDARQAKPGLFQLAHRGMLFLDEIGMLSPALQAKLLKVLEDGVVRRLGSTRAEPVDVWIVSATNEDLAESLRARRFREDLYHRLAVLSLELPPLRERGEDVLVLADRFLARAGADYGLPPKTFARDARAALAKYGWPGNVRELGNVVERVALLADEPVVTAAMLALPVATTSEDRPGAEPSRAMSSRDQMRAHLLEVLTETGGNISQTAVRLGVARNTVLARMARFGLNPARPRPGDVPRRQAAETARPDVPTPLVAASRAAWEPRRVALLRVDVVISAAAGSGEASRVLDEMSGKVQTFGGDMAELGPGAFVAVFGLEAVEDAPVRAALAALAILKASERARSDGDGPRVKIVVHVAQALVSQHQRTGTIDLESKRAAWTAIEALVGLEALDTIVVSEASAPFLERRFELTPATGATAVPFRRLTRRERTGFGLGGRPLSRFVGRDGELRLVRDRLVDAERGRGQVIGIVGEPGVGKSRFVYELTRIDPTHGWRVLGAHGASHGSTTPFFPVSDLLRRYFAIEDADEPELIRENVTETILSRHEELTSSLTPLLSLLDIAVDDPSWTSLDPPQRRQHIQDAVKRLLLQESRIQPLLVIVEDLQWIDTETQALLDGLVESLPTARLLLLVNYRPQYQHRWGSKTYYSQLRLDALAPERAGKLVNALLGEDPGLEPVEQLLVKRGNPFFIEESIRTLVETQVLVGERGAYRLTRTVQAIEVPATVQVILAARIDRLPAEDRQLLQTASVIGKDVPFVLLDAVADAEEDEVRGALARLRAAEFLYETRLFPDPEYTFKHALTHDVTYGTLLPDRRRDLHARIVGAIERVYPERLNEHVERLAHHAVRGEMWEPAVTYLRQAAVRAGQRCAYVEAAAGYDQALTALSHLGGGPERDTLEVDLRLAICGCLSPLARYAAILEHMRKADDLATALGDRPRLAHVLAGLSQALRMRSDHLKGIEVGERAVSLADEIGEVDTQIAARYRLAQSCRAVGQFVRSRDLLAWTVEALDRRRAHETAVVAHSFNATVRIWLALGLATLGDLEAARSHAAEALRIAESTERPLDTVGASGALGIVEITAGRTDEAIAFLERSLRVNRQWEISNWLTGVTAHLGLAYARQRRFDEAFALLDEALAVDTAVSGAPTSPRLRMLAMALVLGARVAEARGRAEQALTLARAGGQRGEEAYVLAVLGDVACHPTALDPSTAQACYRDALALAEQLGMRPLVAHCHLGLGRLLASGDHLSAAVAMLREMGIVSELAEAERALAAL